MSGVVSSEYRFRSKEHQKKFTERFILRKITPVQKTNSAQDHPYVEYLWMTLHTKLHENE